MIISPTIEIIDLALYVKGNVILADSHIGFEEALNKQGILVPRFHFQSLLKRLDATFSRLKGKKIRKIIINGDIKHEFGTISEQEWRHTLRLLDYLGKRCKDIVLIKGNHDTILGPIASKRNVRIVDYYVIKKEGSGSNILVTHGDKMPDKKALALADTIIIGHEHPAVSIKSGPRVELFKCFLKGKYKNRNLIVQPSLNLVTEGTDVMKEKLLSPFLQQNLADFEVFVVADKVYRFGTLKGLA
jgi:hypothetical protein